jgi:TfoX/Sxy family transcriptional regulator of competence genes
MAHDGAERFEVLVATMLERPGTTYGAAGGAKRAFGSTSLKTNGKIFAMLVHGRLVVKLDRRRVDALVDSGVGARFDPGHGRLMKEWLDVHSDSDQTWLDLATESEAFVANRS